MVTQAYINRDLLSWARERRSLSVDELTNKFKNYAKWESGDAYPTFRQAQQLANVFKVPLGYLYLSCRPEEYLPLPDLRVKADTKPINPSPDFLEVLYDALRKQEWYHEYMIVEGITPLEFISRFRLEDDLKEIAEDIRSTLGIDDKLRKECSTWGEFLTVVVSRAEDAGILVLRSGVVGNNTHRPLNVDEFRGFAIIDDLAPLIFINSKDAKVAQIFTLAHELVHLWVGESGVSNPDYALRSNQQQNDIEKICNSIAAEVLVPASDFLNRWKDHDDIDQNLERLTPRYKVSTFVVLRRAYELGKVPDELYRSKYRELRLKSTGGGEDPGGDFWKTFFARNSRNFTTKVMVAAAEDKVSPKEAAKLLNVRISTLFGYSEGSANKRLADG